MSVFRGAAKEWPPENVPSGAPTREVWASMTTAERTARIETEREAAGDPAAIGPFERIDLDERLAEAATREAETAAHDADLAAALRDARFARLGARWLHDISTDPPPPCLLGRLDPLGHSILYGTGGVGKGLEASWWMVQLVRLGHRVLILDYENHPEEWARRIAGLGGPDVLADILHVAPLTAAWTGTRGALWKQADDIRQLAESFDATYLVIDSVVPACAGSDPLDAGTPALYAGGLEYIGRPALSLAHVTKAGDVTYPFGSAFWHNLSRVTWSLVKDGPRATLVNRKHNNYPHLGRFSVSTTWVDDRPGEVWEQPYSAVLAERIAEVLGTDALTAKEIVTRLADEEDAQPIKRDSVEKALKRGITSSPQRFTVEGTGEGARWRIVS